MKCLCAVFLIVFLCAGCTQEQPAEGVPVTIYTQERISDHSALANYTIYSREEAEIWKVALNAVLIGTDEFPSVFSPDVTVLSAYLENGTANITLSQEAATLYGYALTLARACIALTLDGLNGIDSVNLAIDGQPPEIFTANDFILGPLVTDGAEHNITLYFSNAEGTQTISENRTLIVRETDTVDRYLHYILEELIAGPNTPGALPVIPEGTELLTIIITGEFCTINLSGEFITNAPNNGLFAHMTLSCLVRSITSQQGISYVSLMVDGQPLDIYFDIDISEPISALESDWLVG
jgi:spore germination protein GerM